MLAASINNEHHPPSTLACCPCQESGCTSKQDVVDGRQQQDAAAGAEGGEGKSLPEQEVAEVSGHLLQPPGARMQEGAQRHGVPYSCAHQPTTSQSRVVPVCPIMGFTVQSTQLMSTFLPDCMVSHVQVSTSRIFAVVKRHIGVFCMGLLGSAMMVRKGLRMSGSRKGLSFFCLPSSVGLASASLYCWHGLHMECTSVPCQTLRNPSNPLVTPACNSINLQGCVFPGMGLTISLMVRG